MTEEQKKAAAAIAEAVTVESFEDFEAGASKSEFHLEEGSYDGAVVVGYQIVKAEFEGKERTQIKLLWQLTDDEGVIHTLRGSGWTISANEKSKMRQELSKWFDETDWKKVCSILVKGGILVKHEDGKAHFEFKNFIGKRAKLLIAEKTSKKGSKYPVIMSISKTKKKDAYEFGEVPWFLAEGDDLIAVELAEGVKIRQKSEEDSDGVENPVTAPAFGATVTQNPNPKDFMGVDPKLQVTNPAPQPAGPDVVTAEQAMAQEGLTEGDDDDDGEDLPF